MNATQWVLAVDFGTVNTAAALRDPSGRVSELRLSNTGVLMPSAVLCTNQQLLVGEGAIEAGSHDPRALELYPKRRLGTDTIEGNLMPTEPRAYVPSLVAAVLSNVLSRTREVTGGDLPEQLVLTYPDIHQATFSESSQLRDGLQEAADLLACPSCRLVPDSMAVSCFAETEAQLVAPALLLLDFGAVRCDAVVLTQQDDRRYAPVAFRSVDRLGGFALEDEVRTWVNRALQSRSAALVPAVGEPFPGSRLPVDLPIRDAIDALAVATSADIEINGRADPTVLRLTRDRFDVLSRGYVDAAVQLTREMLAVADELKNSSSGTVIILTGAAARNRTIRSRIAALGFVADFGDPATLIARGAAYHGAPPSAARPRYTAAAVDGGSRPAAVCRAPEGRSEGEAPTPQPADRTRPRTLRANVTREGRVRRRSLAPHHEHQLEVCLAVPRGRGAGADEAAIADGDRAAELIVDVCTDDGSVHETASLALPMCDRTRASTVAVVKFVTGDDGSTLRLNITVLYEGRPIQAAVLQAPIRAKPSWRDRVLLLAVPLSAAPEPREDMTKADATVECTETTLKRLGTTDHIELPLRAVEDITAVIEDAASKVLSAKDAPATLDQPVAVRLLVNLARLGSQLADKLADLGLTDAHRIAMKTRWQSPVVPLELAYDGVAPDQNAQLCECVSDPIIHPGARTSHASRQTVCPYAFWAMNRLILRTVGGKPVTRLPARRHLAAVSLRPVLYGAADNADELSLPWELPTKEVEDALSGRAGPSQFTRVSTWRAWRRAVKRDAPELLVVLGDTEMRSGAANLVIGRGSGLALCAVSDRTCAVNAPAPVVLLFACSANRTGDVLDAFPGAFIDKGAAAVVATLTDVGAPAAAEAATAVVHALHSDRPCGRTLHAALTEARRHLIAKGSAVGLLLVAHGEIDIPLTAQHLQASLAPRRMMGERCLPVVTGRPPGYLAHGDLSDRDAGIGRDVFARGHFGLTAAADVNHVVELGNADSPP